MKYLLDTDHISFLQRRSGSEFSRLTVRMAQHPIADFTLSVVSFHEQVLGAHNFINRARTNTDIIRGYVLFLLIGERIGMWRRSLLFLLIGDRTLVVAQLSRIQKSFLFIQKERL